MSYSDLITTAQAAAILGCSRRTIARMAEDGRLDPAVKFPAQTGAYLFTRAQVEGIRDAPRAKAS